MFKYWIILKPVLGTLDGSLYFPLLPWTGSIKKYGKYRSLEKQPNQNKEKKITGSVLLRLVMRENEKCNIDHAPTSLKPSLQSFAILFFLAFLRVSFPLYFKTLKFLCSFSVPRDCPILLSVDVVNIMEMHRMKFRRVVMSWQEWYKSLSMCQL